jgi:preprotein translocase subunit SecG
MYQVIIVFHILFGLGVIGLVLMQQGKGADAGAAFGTGTSGSVFGAQGAASFLSRTTAIFAALFFTTSLVLAVLNSHKGAVYDLMSEPNAEKETPAITADVDSKAAESLPSVPAAAPVSVEQSAPSFVAGAEIKETTVPKAEAVKTVDEKKNAADQASTPAKK